MKGSQIFGHVLSLRKSICLFFLRTNNEEKKKLIHETVLGWLKFHSL